MHTNAKKNCPEIASVTDVRGQPPSRVWRGVPFFPLIRRGRHFPFRAVTSRVFRPASPSLFLPPSPRHPRATTYRRPDHFSSSHAFRFSASPSRAGVFHVSVITLIYAAYNPFLFFRCFFQRTASSRFATPRLSAKKKKKYNGRRAFAIRRA